MVLRDVVEAVRDRAAHRLGRIVAQPGEDRQKRPRIGDEGLEPQPPGQARPGAFRRQAADVRAGVLRPGGEPGERAAGSAAMSGRTANSALKRLVISPSTRMARSKSPPPRAATTSAIGITAQPRRPRASEAATSATPPASGCSAASMRSQAAAKSAGRCVSSARVICAERAFSSRSSSPAPGHRLEAGAIELAVVRRQMRADGGDELAAEDVLERLHAAALPRR